MRIINLGSCSPEVDFKIRCVSFRKLKISESKMSLYMLKHDRTCLLNEVQKATDILGSLGVRRSNRINFRMVLSPSFKKVNKPGEHVLLET